MSVDDGAAPPVVREVLVTITGQTDVGNERELNEDNFLVADLTLRARNFDEDARPVGPKGIVFAVCDGMGGAAGGEIASELAVETLYQTLAERPTSDKPLDRDEVSASLAASVEACAARIHDEARADKTKKGMGTTMTAAALVDRHLVFAQVGDSRGYVLRSGHLTQVTRDQSLVAKLLEQGVLTEEEAANYEHANIILQALGTTPKVIPELTYVELARGDRVLICSDGLHGLVPNHEIQTFLTCGATPRQICLELIERAKELGGTDNITAIVAFFEGDGLTSEAGNVVVRARDGSTELKEIPDPRRLGAIATQGDDAATGEVVAVERAVTTTPSVPPEAQRPTGPPAPPESPRAPSNAPPPKDPSAPPKRSEPPSFPVIPTKGAPPKAASSTTPSSAPVKSAPPRAPSSTARPSVPAKPSRQRTLMIAAALLVISGALAVEIAIRASSSTTTPTPTVTLTAEPIIPPPPSEPATNTIIPPQPSSAEAPDASVALAPSARPSPSPSAKVSESADAEVPRPVATTSSSASSSADSAAAPSPPEEDASRTGDD